MHPFAKLVTSLYGFLFFPFRNYSFTIQTVLTFTVKTFLKSIIDNVSGLIFTIYPQKLCFGFSSGRGRVGGGGGQGGCDQRIEVFGKIHKKKIQGGGSVWGGGGVRVGGGGVRVDVNEELKFL